MDKQQMWQISRSCIAVMVIIVIGFLIHYTAKQIYPFLLATILSLFLNPIVTYMEKTFKMSRGFASFVVLFFTIASVMGLMIIFVAELVHGTVYLADVIPEHFRSFMTLMEAWINKHLLPLYHQLASFLQTLNPEQQKGIHDTVHRLLQRFASMGAGVLNNVLSQISRTLTLLPGSITFLLFTVLATFFITKDWYKLLAYSKQVIPRNLFKTGERVWQHLQKIFTGYIKAQLLLITLTAVTMLIGLFLLQINYALTITLLTALADLLPFIGTGLVFLPWILYLFLTGDYPLTIGLAILYMILVVQRQVLEPKIMSTGIGLNPLVILLALFIGFQIWGALGLFIAPFLAIIGNAFFQAGVFHQLGRFIKGP